MLKSRSAFLRLAFICLLSTLVGVSCTKKNENENTLNVELKANIKGLDPAQSNDLYVANVLSVVYESLYQYNYLKRPLVLEPSLAAGMPVVSKDSKTYTIKIKPGVKFQDSEIFPGGKGRELVAKDFIYSWLRLADPSVQSEGFWVIDGKVAGVNEWRDKKAKGEATYDTPVEGLQAPDDHTLVIKLTKPNYQFLYQLAVPYTAAMPHEMVEKYGRELINHAVGTGPYKLDEWIRNSRLSFSKSPTWRGETYPTSGDSTDEASGFLKDAGKAIPFADKVVFFELPEDQPRWLNFMKGATDFVEIPKDNFDSSIKGDQIDPEYGAKGIAVRKDPDPDLTYDGFNMLDPILGKNDLVRKAMALAQDMPTLLDKFYNGRGINAQSPIPPSVDAYDPNFVNPYKQSNVEKAKELLAKAGYPEGKGLPEFEFSIYSGATSRQLAEFFQQNMAKIGIKINISITSWPQFTDKLREKKAQIFGIAWSADYPDAENFLQLLYGPNESPGTNNSNYHSKEFDALYEKAATLPPGEARNEVYKKMRDIFVKDMPWIPELHRLRYQLYHTWLANFKPNLIILNPYKYMRIDVEKKKAQKVKL
jgi:oligopeptide transport system substrate-binding protein